MRRQWPALGRAGKRRLSFALVRYSILIGEYGDLPAHRATLQEVLALADELNDVWVRMNAVFWATAWLTGAPHRRRR